jgi:hypothetical protein
MPIEIGTTVARCPPSQIPACGITAPGSSGRRAHETGIAHMLPEPGSIASRELDTVAGVFASRGGCFLALPPCPPLRIVTGVTPSGGERSKHKGGPFGEFLLLGAVAATARWALCREAALFVGLGRKGGGHGQRYAAGGRSVWCGGT